MRGALGDGRIEAQERAMKGGNEWMRRVIQLVMIASLLMVCAACSNQGEQLDALTSVTFERYYDASDAQRFIIDSESKIIRYEHGLFGTITANTPSYEQVEYDWDDALWEEAKSLISKHNVLKWKDSYKSAQSAGEANGTAWNVTLLFADGEKKTIEGRDEFPPEWDGLSQGFDELFSVSP